MDLSLQDIMILLGEKDLIIAELTKKVRAYELAQSAIRPDRSETRPDSGEAGRVEAERGIHDQQAAGDRAATE